MTNLSESVGFVDHVEAIEPDTNLVNGGVYQVVLQYQDAVGNPKNADWSEFVTFAGSRTLPPIFQRPESYTSVRDSFFINFTLPEQASPGTVQMEFRHNGDPRAVPDPDSPHVVTFGPDIETRGEHPFTIQPLSTTTGLSAVAAVSPAGKDLINGAVYVLSLIHI